MCAAPSRDSVLVVDDEVANRELLAALLANEGYDVVQASDGIECLDLLPKHSVGIVLLDVLMPRLGGVETCRRIRLEHPGLPVIMVTALHDRSTRIAALEAGADDLLGKPIDDLELIARVKNLIQLRKARESRERSRRRSEADALVRLVYEAIGCGVIAFDAQGVIVEANEACAEMFGVGRDAMLGKRVRELVNPLRPDGSPLPIEERALGRVLSSQTPVRGIDVSFIRPDGEHRAIRLDGVPIVNNGSLDFIVATLIDETTRRAAEEALRRSERMLRDAQRLAKVGSFEEDVQSGATWWSEEMYRICGVDADSFHGSLQQVLRGLLHPVDGAPSATTATTATGRLPSGHYRIEVEPNVTKHLAISVELLTDADGAERLAGAAQDITARVLAEERRANLERRFERVVRSISDALVIEGPDGRVTFANQRFFELFGIGDDQVGSIRLGDVLSPKARRQLAERRLSLLSGRASSHRFECETRSADGRTLGLEVSMTPISVDGRFEGTQAILRDITERKRTEGALEFLSTRLIHVTGDAMFGAVAEKVAELVGAHVGIVAILGRAGSRVARTVGLSIDGHRVEPREIDLAGTPCEVILDRNEALFPAEVAKTFPACSLTKQLGARACAGIALRDSSDHPLGVLVVMSRAALPQDTLGVLRLFAVRVASEITRQRTETRFQDLFELAPDAMFMVDEDGRVLMANRQAEIVFGCSRDNLVGVPVAKLFPSPSDRPRFFRPTTSPSVQRQLHRVSARRADGTMFPAELVVRPMPYDDGVMIATTVRDLSELVEAEEKRLAVEAQLLHLQKLEAIGTLASGIAHDFNNILTAVSANIELARDMLTPEHPVTELIDEIGVASTRAARLVRQILAFSRKERPERAPVKVRALLEEVGTLLRAALPAGVELTVLAEQPGPIVLGNATQLHQVLMNLCTNAWHALEGQPGRITMTQVTQLLQRAETGGLPPGYYALLTVSDTGVGMDAQTLDRIFEPFFTTKPVGKGSGLGLAVVHGIVRDHGGTIRATSTRGVGTKFELLLPTIEDATESEPPRLSGRFDRSGGRIMFIDDEDSLVRAGVRVLERFGYRVKGFSNPRDAVSQLVAAPTEFDIVVTDLNMPELSGIDVAAAVHQVAPSTPIVLVSGYFDEQLQGASATAGVREVVAKPYDPGSLAEVIRRLLTDV